MKKYLIFFVVILVSFVFSVDSFAVSYKSLAKDDIGMAHKVQKKLHKKGNLQPFIPYKNYHDGAKYLDKAAHEYDDEENYEIASYYAILAFVEFEIAKNVAQARLYKHKLLIAERDEYKNAAKNEMLKAAIAGANLVKTGRVYIANIEDKNLFKSRSLKLLPKGEAVLNKILQVTKLYPESKLLIKGHTRYRDRDNKRSKQKADKISEYYVMTKGLDEIRLNVKGVGNQEPMEVRGKDRKVERIEIIITGVK